MSSLLHLHSVESGNSKRSKPRYPMASGVMNGLDSIRCARGARWHREYSERLETACLRLPIFGLLSGTSRLRRLSMERRSTRYPCGAGMDSTRIFESPSSQLCRFIEGDRIWCRFRGPDECLHGSRRIQYRHTSKNLSRSYLRGETNDRSPRNRSDRAVLAES